MIKMETERLILLNYKIDDFNEVYDYFSNEEVARYEDFYPMTEKEVEDQINEWKDKDNRMVVELKDEHTVIGSVGYFVDEDGDYSIDYDFNPCYSKNGYATEAAKELLKYLFNTLGVKEVYGDCHIHNKNSWKLLEKLGFKRIKQIDDASYKDDTEGNKIIISIYVYKTEKNI